MPFTAPENPKPVKAKFYVKSVTLQQWATTVELEPVTKGEDNKGWSTYTPSGNLKMNVTNTDAAEQFFHGQEWFIEFTPAPPEPSKYANDPKS